MVDFKPRWPSNKLTLAQALFCSVKQYFCVKVDVVADSAFQAYKPAKTLHIIGCTAIISVNNSSVSGLGTFSVW